MPRRGPPPSDRNPASRSSRGQQQTESGRAGSRINATSGGVKRPRTNKGPPSFESDQRIERAAQVLASWELLCMHATTKGESIPQTRLRYQKLLVGIPDNNDVWVDEVDVSYEEATAGTGSGGDGGEGGDGERGGGGGGTAGRNATGGGRVKKEPGSGDSGKKPSRSGASGSGTTGRLKRERSEAH